MSGRGPSRLGLIVGVLLASLLCGSAAAWAAWSAQATATARATVTSVRITQNNFPSLGTTRLNTFTSLTTTGSFTVTNTGQASGTLGLSLSGSGPLASKLGLTLWPVSSAAACTSASLPPTSPAPASGSWAAASYTAPSQLAAGASQAFCVRTLPSGAGASPTMPAAQSLADTSGTLTSSTTLTATLTAAGFTASDSTGLATQRTEAIFPVATGYRPDGVSDWFTLSSSAAGAGSCLASTSVSAAAGTTLVSAACNASASPTTQVFQFTPVAASSPAAMVLRPLSSHTLNLGVNDAGVLQLATPAASTAAQQWVVQQSADARVQLVSAATGRCLVLNAATPLTTADCNTAGTKMYLNRKPITATSTSSGMTLQWAVSNPGQPLYVQINATLGLAWSNWATIPAANTAVAQPLAPPALWLNLGDAGVRVSASSIPFLATDVPAIDVLWQGTARRNGSSATLITGGG
ncbi:MAG: hypothetical protein LBE25_08430 [Arthrobacter sp.]|jgi:hypothetical protein|nr:hypothetical protein [Arthrobacter sp.]